MSGIDGKQLEDGSIFDVKIATAAAIAETKLALNFATHSNSNDPTSGEKAALPGTSGTPGGGNRYVTDGDSRNTNDRDPTSHAFAGADHSASTLSAVNGKVSDATLIDTNDSRLSNDRDPTLHAFAGADHSASTLASVNGKISNATLIDTGDSRLSNDRDPTSHAFAGADHSSSTLASVNSKISNADLLAEIFVGRVHLGTVVVGSPVASVAFTAGIDSTYLFYQIRFWCTPANDNVQLNMRTDASGGSSFDTGASDYRWGNINVRTSGSIFGQTDNADTLIRLLLGAGNVGGSQGEGVAGEVTLHDPSGTTIQKLITSEVAYERENGIANSVRGVSQRQNIAIINAVQFFFSAGNIASGEFHLYGIR